MSCNNIVKTWSNEEGTASGAWITNKDYIVGLDINCDGNDNGCISIHHNSHNPIGHSIALYVKEDGTPMLQATLDNRVESINLLDLISFVKKKISEETNNE